jgi:pyruvate ferredoxin oxidoreductase gamma subunit
MKKGDFARKQSFKQSCNNENSSLTEIKIHGKDGQGVVIAGQLLAIAAFHDGKYSQAFPSFYFEGKDLLAASSIRISDRPINLREQVYNQDYEIFLDPESIQLYETIKGPRKKTAVNNKREIRNCTAKDINKKAVEIFGRPIVNTLLLGVFAAYTKLITLDSLLKAAEERFRENEELIIKNKRAIREAYTQEENG